MLSLEEIAFFIQEDSSSARKSQARVGERYYDGEHDIINYKLFYYDADGKIDFNNYAANESIPIEKIKNGIKNLTDGTEPNSLQTPNSQAISEGAVALGKNSIAGSKCFNITAFDDANKSYTLDSVEGLEVGDVYSLKLDNNYDNKGTITAINGNVVTVSDYQGDETTATVRYFRVPLKPTCGTTDFGLNAVALGENCISAGDNSFTAGYGNLASGRYSFATGFCTEATFAGYAEGRFSKALATDTHAEGQRTKVTGIAGHSEGKQTEVSADFGHSEGSNTKVKARSGHSEGEQTEVGGIAGHAEGSKTKANAWAAHSEGEQTEANRADSHAQGKGTIANSLIQDVMGRYNIPDSNNKYAHIVGNGASDTARSNCHTLDWDGNAWYAGDVENGDGDKLSEKANAVDLLNKADKNIAFTDIIRITTDSGTTLSWDTYDEIKSITKDGVYLVNIVANGTNAESWSECKNSSAILFVSSYTEAEVVTVTQTLFTAQCQTLTRFAVIDDLTVWSAFTSPNLDNDGVTTNKIKDKAITTAKLADDVRNRLYDGTVTIANESIDDSAELKNTTEVGVYRVLLDDGVAQDSGILINHQRLLSNYSQTLILDGKTYYRTGAYSSTSGIVWTKFETTDKIKEYGVRWNGGSSTSCERLGDAKGLVANAYKGSTDTAVVNDFDNIYPWSGMRRCNVNENGDILAYEDDPNFKLDGTNGDVMVEIPKFYYKRTKTGTVEEWWICGTKLPGYELHPLFIDNGKEVSKVFHSAYNASSFTDETDNKVKLQSITGVQPRVRTKRANFRTYARNKGDIWGIEDISCVNALQLLYLVEYANTNSQSVLGCGVDSLSYSANHKALEETTNGNTITIASTYKNVYKIGQRIEIGTSQGVNNITTTPRTVTAITTDDETGQTTITFDGDPITIAVGNMIWNVAPLNGSCDDLNGKSGWLAGENNYSDHYADVNYRGIEGFHAKLLRFIDGVNIKDIVVYYANSMSDYADGVYDGKYRAVGYSNAEVSGYISAFGYDEKAPWVMFPTEAKGGSTTFVPDYYSQNTGERLLALGGLFLYGANAGAFYFSCLYGFSVSNLYCGAHLLVKKP